MRGRLRDKLSSALPSEELTKIFNSFDIIGDIAILKAAKDDVNSQASAKQIMAVHKNVKTVFIQTGPVRGDYRVRELKLLAGEDKTRTRYRELGCVFAVDVEKCYFSPRLSHERARIAQLVNSGETVVNMFAGVGCFSVLIAKTAPHTKVYSIDVNPTAFDYMEENVKINRVYGRVTPILGDSKDVIITQLQHKADRILMPLPEKALDYLPYAIMALKPIGGWIHLYDFQHAKAKEDPTERTKQKVAQKLDSCGLRFAFGFSHVVRTTGPNWYQTVLDIQVYQVPSKF